MFDYIKAVFNFISKSALFSPLTYIRVSSANILTLHSSGQTSIMSFIYNINYKGPSIEPCGTPYFVVINSDHV